MDEQDAKKLLRYAVLVAQMHEIPKNEVMEIAGLSYVFDPDDPFEIVKTMVREFARDEIEPDFDVEPTKYPRETERYNESSSK